MSNENTPEFQPTLLGTTVSLGGEATGMVTDETETSIFIESDFFTGWMSKPEFWESLGIEE